MAEPIKKIEELVVVSKANRLTPQDWAKWFSDQLQYLKPLGIFIVLLYLTFLIPRIQDNGISLQDFQPTNEVLTSIALYICNGIYNIFSKFRDEKSYVIKK